MGYADQGIYILSETRKNSQYIQVFLLKAKIIGKLWPF